MNASVLKGRVARVVITGAAALGILAFGATAFAQTATAPQARPQGAWMGGGQGQGKAPGVFGTVSAINGTTLTVSSKGFGKSATATTYTVSAGSATVTKNNAASSVSAIAVGDTVMVQGTVSGTSVAATMIRDGVGMGMGGGRMGAGMAPGVFGTVASVSGTTLTVTSKAGPNGTPAAATYTVDASSATVTKAGAASSVSAIAVGDTVMVQGTVSGTSVTAKTIRDGVMQGPGMKPQAPIIQGNGEPVVGGAVASISGTTLTVTNKSNVTYSVDASSATVEKGNATSSISSVAVGDNVVVQGTVNGTSVVASSVIDQGAASASGSSGGAGGMMHGGAMGGVLGAIGGFFQHLFGFF